MSCSPNTNPIINLTPSIGNRTVDIYSPLAYIYNMKIVETTIFTKKISSLLTEEEYRNLQNELILNPEKGKLIQGSGGLRKIRWGISGRGKSGGVRIIYYLALKKEIILMLLIYPKNEQDNLTSTQLKILKSIVEEEIQ